MVCHGRSILRSGVDSDAMPPYSPAQIQETATHSEILKIYDTAKPETRMYYDLGHDTAPIAPENWVVRWLLWHVFRYRDSRNKGRGKMISPRTAGLDSDGSEDSISPPAGNGQDTSFSFMRGNSKLTGAPVQYPVTSPTPPRRPYDPVRDG